MADALGPARSTTSSLNTDGYRGWMAEFGVVSLEKRFNPFDEDDSQHFQLTATRADGREFHTTAYEHGPHDPCGQPTRCGGGMFGWSSVDSGLQVLGFQIEAAARTEKQGGAE